MVPHTGMGSTVASITVGGGVRLHVEIAGDGPPVVLLHGLTSSVAALAPEIAFLSPWRRTIAIDARGHGASDKPPAYTLDDHVADVLAVMDRLGVARAALLGRSMGSYVAQGVAIAAPDRIDDLVLVVPRAHAVESSLARLRRAHAADLDGRDPDAQRALLRRLMLAPTTPERTASLLATLATRGVDRLTPAEEVAAMAAVAVFDFRPHLHRITARTWVVSGRHDRLNPPAEGAIIAAAVAGARHAVLERAGHLPAVEDRDAYLAAVGAALLTGHVGAAATRGGSAP
jgi:3-oxoadipate enol-lactonase